jgi:hypothetical protein
MRSNGKSPWRRAALVAAVGMAVLIGCSGSSVRAEDEEEVPLDTKMLRGFLSALGLQREGGGAGIDYRERSPLVLPPGRELPQPEKGNADKIAGWPDDPDIKQIKQRREAERKRQPYTEGVDDRPMLPSEYSRSAPPSSRRTGGDGPTKSAEDVSRPMSPMELGSKNIFSSFFSPKEEYTTFSNEPPRDSLTDPPAGYRTPSPNQPYGVGKEKWKPETIDRHKDVK